MTIGNLLNALPIIEKIMGLNLPVRKSYEVYSLAKVINEKRDFFIKEEKKLIDRLNLEVSENGIINFKSDESRNEFIQEYNKITNCVVDDFNAVDLKFSDLEESEFKPAEIAMIEGIINFID